MRTALILVGLGTLAVMELEAPPRTTKPVSEPLAQTTVGVAVSRDTLTAVDRLAIAHVQHETPVQPISPVEPPPPERTAFKAQEPTKTIEPRKRDASAGRSAVMLPRPRPKPRIAKATANTSRSKAIVETKACRPGAFDGLLKALNLSPGCET
jgi:hypothetical protein